YAGGPGVSQSCCAGRVDPKEVSGERVPLRAGANHPHAGPVVAADDVPRGDGGSADGVIGGAGLNADAVDRVAQVEHATDVRADEIAGHEVALRACVADGNAGILVRRDDVAFGHITEAVGVRADPVELGAQVDCHAVRG